MTLSNTGVASQGLVYLTLAGVDASGHAFTEQGSGVLLSGDEVLTAAHLVYNDDGSLRTAGTAAVGYGGGRAAAVSSVDGVQVEARRDYATVAGMEHDFAVVHLSRPVADGTLFALGSDLAPGTFDVGGYPVGTSGTLDTRTEALGVADGTEVFTGGALDDGTRDPDGSSGGSVYRVVDGVPTAYGVISADLSGDPASGFFKGLTAGDVAEIRSWVAAADAAPAADAAGGDPATASVPGLSADVASSLAADAAGHTGILGAVMSDVAAAIAEGCADGGGFARMAGDAAAELAGSSYAKRAVAYLTGLLFGTAGTWLGGLPGGADAPAGGPLSRMIAAGRTEGASLAAQGASADAATLAGAIAGGAPAGPVQSLQAIGADAHRAFALVAHHGLG